MSSSGKNKRKGSINNDGDRHQDYARQSRLPTRGRAIADDMILQAEQFKVQVTAPTGRHGFVNNTQLPLEIKLLRQIDNDR